MRSGKATNSPAPPSMHPDASLSAPQLDAGASWSGLPRFQWSLTLIGCCIFSIAVVTSRFPFAEVGVAIAAVGLMLQLSKLRVPIPVWLYAAFLLWAYVASFRSPYAGIAHDQIMEQLKFLVIMLITVNALRTEGQLRFYLLLFLACYMIYPVRGTLVTYADGYNLLGRAVWNNIYSNSNDLATLSLLPLGVALGFMFSAPSRLLVRLGAGISVVLLLVVILLAQSRGAFIGLVAGMGPALIGLGLKRPGRLLLSAGVLALVLGLSVPAATWERLSGIRMLTSTSTIELADPEGSAAQRFEIQKVAWQIFLDNRVFGVGLGAYPEVNAAYAPHLGKRDTHNTYLNLAAEVGLPGLALWCAMVWSVLRYAYRSRRLAAPGELAIQHAWLERALWAYLVAGMFGTYVQITFPYLMLATLWCSANLMAASSLRSQAAGPPTKA